MRWDNEQILTNLIFINIVILIRILGNKVAIMCLYNNILEACCLLNDLFNRGLRVLPSKQSRGTVTLSVSIDNKYDSSLLRQSMTEIFAQRTLSSTAFKIDYADNFH